MHRVVITGCAGYLGSRLAETLRARGCVVLGVDVRAREGQTLDRFARLDICDPALLTTIQNFGPDTVIHSAFAVTPLHDRGEMRRVNVEGTRNLLAAVAAADVERLMVISSATAYGAWPDNPPLLDEDQPLRARHEFPYAADKVEVEGLVAAFAAEHPELPVSWVRPCMVGGPTANNYMSRAYFDTIFLLRLDGFDQPLQFVHEDDLVAAILAILTVDGRGAFNIGPADTVLTSALGRRRDRWVMRLPMWFCWLACGIGWKLRLPYIETPPGLLYFLRYPWVVRSRRLEALGFRFQYTTAETAEMMVQVRERQTGRDDHDRASLVDAAPAFEPQPVEA